jgi:uncharacterized membrane protein
MHSLIFLAFDPRQLLEFVYIVSGLILLIFAIMTFRDRTNPSRIGSGVFWLVLAIIFMMGAILPNWLTGVLVLIMAALDGAGRVKKGNHEEPPKAALIEHARRLGDRIFVPVLIIPIVTLMVAAAFRLSNQFWKTSLDISSGALIGLVLGSLIAMVVCLKLTGSSTGVMMHEGRRLNDAMGTVTILPQLLASLGAVFTAAKVGDLIAGGITRVIPEHNLFLLVFANCLGMAVFTIIMGNSFAAFPVIATGVLAPLIIKPFGANPAMVAIITLTAGSSGTLITPMAANFNILPTTLLNMRDQYGVIKFQLPYALTIWSCHVILMWLMIKWF